MQFLKRSLINALISRIHCYKREGTTRNRDKDQQDEPAASISKSSASLFAGAPVSVIGGSLVKVVEISLVSMMRMVS